MTSQFLEIELFKSWEEFLPIDAMGIKFRAIHTVVFSEELVFLMDGDHAGTAHPGSISHLCAECSPSGSKKKGRLSQTLISPEAR